MRNLTVRRRKEFAGCLTAVQIYIEDAQAEELRISGVPCRKLGSLKNGEEKTFCIDSREARLYAISDKLSRSYSNDFYPIPAGEEDLTVSGAYRYTGSSMFCFDGVTDPEQLANRKKKSRVGLIVIILAAILGVIAGRSTTRLVLRESTDPKTFTGEGLTIQLTEAFSETEYDGYTLCFESREVAVFALEEEFSLLPGSENMTLQEYADLVLYANDLTADIQQTDGVTWFTYSVDNADTGSTYVYYATVHKGPEGFWLIQFAADQENWEEYAGRFQQWAASVTFH